MLAALIPALAGLIGKVVDKAIPDKAKAEELKATLTAEVLRLNTEELKAASSIILAEAQGESWLQRNWRPVMMLWFGVLLGIHWFGLTPENLTEPTVLKLFSIIQVGIGGYIVGRSGEKIVKEWKKPQV